MTAFLRLLFLSFWLALSALTAPLLAQVAPVTPDDGDTSLDFVEWEAEAERIERLIEGGTASTAFLENVRQDLVDWRMRFTSAETANTIRIDTIEALDA